MIHAGRIEDATVIWVSAAAAVAEPAPPAPPLVVSVALQWVSVVAAIVAAKATKPKKNLAAVALLSPPLPLPLPWTAMEAEFVAAPTVVLAPAVTTVTNGQAVVGLALAAASAQSATVQLLEPQIESDLVVCWPHL
eukprot:SAG31_NODE_11642_length_1011_cov_0.754386_1_plen_136_part_00